MPSLNEVKLIGNATRDAKVTNTNNGKTVAHFSIACNYKPKGGEDKVTFVPIVAWGAWAEACRTQVKKGTPVFVAGRLEIRKYEARDGTEKQATEVVAFVLGFLKNRAEQENADAAWTQPPEEEAPATEAAPDTSADAAPVDVDEPLPPYGPEEL